MGDWNGLYSVTWNFTRDCNFSCRHCYVPEPEKPDLSTSESKEMLETFVDFGVAQLYISGGEPLLREDLFEIISYARDLGLKTDVITNGWFLSEDMAHKFRESGIGHVSVSLDGREETHEWFRCKSGSFERGIQGIKMLRDSGVGVYLAPTISKKNLKELPFLISLAKELGADFSTKLLIPIGEAEVLKSQFLSPPEAEGMYDLLFEKKEEFDGNMEIETTCTPYATVVEKGGELENARRIRGGCSAGISSLCVNSEGDVMPCSRLQKVLGNIREDSLEEIWFSSKLLLTLRDRNNLGGKCGDCEYKNWCGGCRAMAQSIYDDYLAEDPSCWIGD